MAIERREGHFLSVTGHAADPKGAEIFYQSWFNANAVATLVVTHGMAEHSECYSRTAEKLVPMGWNMIAWDLRGHGRSSGKRGFVEDFHCFSLDLGELLKHLSLEGYLQKPFVLVGHSMGGLISLRHLIDQTSGVPQPKALSLSSPLLGLGLEVPVVKDIAARMLRRVIPSLTMHNELRYEDLNRDPEWQKIYRNDALRHDKISPGLYLGMLENMAFVNSRADLIQLPTLIQAAGAEKIVSLPAIKDFFSKIPSEKKKFILYDESYHEIFNDLDREQVFKDLDAYLKDIMGSGDRK